MRRCSKIVGHRACGWGGGQSDSTTEALTLGEAICRKLSANAMYEVWAYGRTLGGIRVERPRFAMKLILTADWRSISINCSLRRDSFYPGDAPGLAR
jgi:hypothetical protein